MLDSSAVWSSNVVVSDHDREISLSYAAACVKRRQHPWIEAICHILISWAGFTFTVLVAGCVDWTSLFQLCTNEKCGTMSDFVRRLRPLVSMWDGYVVAYAVIVGLYLLWSSIAMLAKASRLVKRRKEIEIGNAQVGKDPKDIKTIVSTFHCTTPDAVLAVLVRHDARLAKLERRGILRQACACVDLRDTSVLEYAIHYTIVSLMDSSNITDEMGMGMGTRTEGLPLREPSMNMTRTILELTKRCRHRMCLLACLWVIALPIILPFVLVHAMLRNAELARGGSFSARGWAPRAKRCLRKPDEWPHETIIRLHNLSKSASQIVSHPGEVWMWVSGVLAFVVAAALSVLAFMALVEEDALLHLNILSRPLVWWGLVLPIIFRWLWGASHPKQHVMDYSATLDLLGDIGVESKRELRALLPQRTQLYARDLLAVLFMPFILVCGLRSRAQTLVETALGATELISQPKQHDDSHHRRSSLPQVRSARHHQYSYYTLPPPQQTERMSKEDLEFAEIDAILRGEM